LIQEIENGGIEERGLTTPPQKKTQQKTKQTIKTKTCLPQ
jgi:hypothetical protein